jgi:phytanoyl-CoA hydroxylase
MAHLRRILRIQQHLTAAPDFKYTASNAGGLLTPEERSRYERDGYIVKHTLFSEEELTQFHERYVSYANGERDLPQGMSLVKDVNVAKGGIQAHGENAVIKLNFFEGDDLWMKEYACSDKILQYVEAFTGQNIKTINSMYVCKPPGLEGSTRHPMHQDLLYFPIRHEDAGPNRIVCAWTAIGDVDRENGCLSVVPGSHRTQNLYEHGYPKFEDGSLNNSGYFGIMDENARAGHMHISMKAGDTLFFHPLLVHGSGVNRSDGFRKAISVHYADAGCKYVEVSNMALKGPDVSVAGLHTQAFVQRKGKGMSKEAIGKLGEKMRSGFKDFFKERARLVRGKPIEGGV